jgi:hypothetical protein
VYMCPCKFLMDTILAAYARRFKMGLPGAYRLWAPMPKWSWLPQHNQGENSLSKTLFETIFFQARTKLLNR